MPAHIIKSWHFQLEPFQKCMVDMIFYFQQRLPPYRRLQLAFPHGHHSPAHLFQRFLVTRVTLPVTFDLSFPKITVRMRYMPVYLMSMPKASVYENHNTILTQHDVWRTWQPLHILAVTIAAREEVTAYNPFRFCIPTPYPRHNSRTLFLAPDIHAV